MYIINIFIVAQCLYSYETIESTTELNLELNQLLYNNKSESNRMYYDKILNNLKIAVQYNS